MKKNPNVKQIPSTMSPTIKDENVTTHPQPPSGGIGAIPLMFESWPELLRVRVFGEPLPAFPLDCLLPLDFCFCPLIADRVSPEKETKPLRLDMHVHTCTYDLNASRSLQQRLRFSFTKFFSISVIDPSMTEMTMFLLRYHSIDMDYFSNMNTFHITAT